MLFISIKENFCGFYLFSLMRCIEKGKHINDKIQMLEIEKMRIEQQSEDLKQQKDEESEEWKAKVK